MIKFVDNRSWLIAIGVTIIISIAVTSYIAGQDSGMAKFSAATDSPLPQQLSLLRGGIALCFLVMFVSLYSRLQNAAWIILSVAILILAGYLWWYFDTLNLIRNLGGLREIGEQEVSRIGYLRTSNWWDFTVLIETIILVIGILIDLSLARKNSKSSDGKYRASDGKN